ncbi:MAG TPA: hypothetical protein VGF86_15490 [Candidatus Tumulicola sp.]|jgi:hypothetical protein
MNGNAERDATDEPRETTEEASKTIAGSEALREDVVHDEAGVEERVRSLAAEIKRKVDAEVDRIIAELRKNRKPPTD